MLSKRLAAGFTLGTLAALMLVADSLLAPYFPLLWVATAAAGALAALELVRLLPADTRPPERVTTLGILAVLAANWVGPLTHSEPWRPIALTLGGLIVAALAREMRVYDATGRAGARVGGAAFALLYLGLLPSFLLQLRWLDADGGKTALMLAATVVAAKGCDIGAYAVGRLVGRTPFTPMLSPQKTREGLLGGLVFAALALAIMECVAPLFRHGVVEAALFGTAVGAAGVVGDLAESMLKRDASAKDAAARIPGFGGVLDVFDSLIFAGPVAYVWLAR